MPNEIQEWLERAEHDFNDAFTLYRSRKHPSFGGACFHSQQCIEKLMKAALMRRRRIPPKTHDLIVLHDLLRKAYRNWDYDDEDSLRILTRGAVVFRYPGEAATRKEARQSLATCRKLREILLALL